MQNKLNLSEYEQDIFKSIFARKKLRQVLSPLDQSIIDNNFEPFVYTNDGHNVYISHAAIAYFISSTLDRFQRFNHQCEKEKLSHEIPVELRETFDDPRIVLSLYPRLRNQLCNLECYCLFTIMRKGRIFFKDEHKFSNNTMRTLTGLFEKYNCGNLF